MQLNRRNRLVGLQCDDQRSECLGSGAFRADLSEPPGFLDCKRVIAFYEVGDAVTSVSRREFAKRRVE